MTELVPGAVGIVVSAPRPEVRAASRALSSRGARARVVILDAALEVAARRGLGRASLAAVAACAGTSKTSVLYHFRSLQGLHREMAARVRELMQAAVQAAAASCTGSPTERAEQLTDALFDPARRGLYLAVNEIMVLGSRDAVVATEVKASYEHAATSVRELLADAPEPVRALAPSLVAAIQGHIDLWLWSGDCDPRLQRESAKRLVACLIRDALTAPDTPHIPSHRSSD